MDKKRPSLSARTFSSPLSPTSLYASPRKGSSGPMLDILTPPASPRQTRSSIDLTKYHSSLPNSDTESSVERTEEGLPICPFNVEILQDHHNRNQIFGYGAWSVVFKGTCSPKVAHNTGLVTPPASSEPRLPFLVAVKKPSRKDAIAILTSEAKILNRLMSVENHESHVILFYGVLPYDSSIVLSAHPLSLEQHIVSCAKRAKATLTTSNMFTPVVGGIKIWLDLSYRLVSTLDWLHNEARIIHGDIKPGNILLQPTDTDFNEGFPYQTLFVDFSSAQPLDTKDITANTLSAVTREYTAPELLKSSVLLDPMSTATPASDVFSLAVTLLVAATGNTMVYPGSIYQRQSFATQGWQVIDFVRNGDEGARVPRHGVVSRTLEYAVLKKDLGRISAATWKELIWTTIAGNEPSKMSKQSMG